MEKKDTIFALSTPYGRSAVAVIRLSGPKFIEYCKNNNKKKRFSNRKANFVTFLTIKVI